MSWPADGKSRFVVARTDGILNLPYQRSGRNESAGKFKNQQATFAILDRAFCHKALITYRTEDVGGSMARRIQVVERVVNGKCAEMNGVTEEAAA